MLSMGALASCLESKGEMCWCVPWLQILVSFNIVAKRFAKFFMSDLLLTDPSIAFLESFKTRE